MRRRRDIVAATVAYALLTLAFTWPLGRGIADDLPADFGDPLLNSWVLAWDSHQLLQALAGHLGALGDYWNANIFYPHPLALAYSEHLTPQAIAILPIYALTGNPIVCYNLVFLSTFVLSALGMFLFVRHATGSVQAAFFAGLAFGFAPYRFGTLSHLHVLSSMWMPFTLWGAQRFFADRRRGSLALATIAWVLQNLSSGYYLLFFTPVLLLYVAWELTRRRLWLDRGVLINLTGAATAAAAMTLPFLVPYLQLRQLGFDARSLGETGSYAADVYGYFTADVVMRLWGGLIRAWPRPEGSLFPGFTIVLAAAFAVAERWWSARRTATPPVLMAARLLAWTTAVVGVLLVAVLLGWTLRLTVGEIELKITSLERLLAIFAAAGAALLLVSPRARATANGWFGSPVGILALITIFAFAMSCGPQIHARGKEIVDENIYALFYRFVPGFDGLRVPARYAMIVALGLAGLAGHGAAALNRRQYGGVIVAGATLLLLAESWAVPLPVNLNSTEYKQPGLTPLPGTLAHGVATPPVYRFIAQLPPTAALAEFPFGEVAHETRYMFYSTVHWRRLANGYSGGAPTDYGLWSEHLRDVLDQPESAWQAILDSRVTHLIVHESSYAGDTGQRVSDWARTHGSREVAVFGSDHVFSVPAFAHREGAAAIY